MKNTKFYICAHCRNIAEMVYDTDIPLGCCGDEMKELVPNTVEASGEKHLPVVHTEDGAVHVNVGAVDHPMAEEHHIEWVYLQTENGGQLKQLKPGAEPNVTFSVEDEKPLAVYAYCNLHGLWMTEV